MTLKLYLLVSAQVTLSATGVRRALADLGFRWRRPKLALPTDPEAGFKLAQLATELAQHTAGSAFVSLERSSERERGAHLRIGMATA